MRKGVKMPFRCGLLTRFGGKCKEFFRSFCVRLIGCLCARIAAYAFSLAVRLTNIPNLCLLQLDKKMARAFTCCIGRRADTIKRHRVSRSFFEQCVEMDLMDRTRARPTDDAATSMLTSLRFLSI